MRYAILADIHSNLEALEAVLLDVDKQGGADVFWCLGDIVGYGPNPEECIKRLSQYQPLTVLGNHDLGATGELDLSYFNPDAAAACLWNAQRLKSEEIRYLSQLPQKAVTDDFTLAHGSPRDPIWEYVLSSAIAQANLAHFETFFCLIGHSHIPLVFESAPGDPGHLRELPLRLTLGERRLIINPGSVGQPRDGDPRASYALYDAEQRLIYHHRVPYPVSITQEKMRLAGLPPRLALRLSLGR
ncbi:MAG: metallophosphoesterase family protein [Chloroflexi bacterium]|nr:metallophosphoesterase family protein [Chloroflexota bacterium]